MSISIFFTLLPLLLTFPVHTMPATTTIITFSITNNCPFPIWPSLLSGAGTPPLPTTGFLLNSDQTLSLDIPSSWSGRLWARTLCSSDPTTSSSSLSCSGAAASTPATLAEFTLNGSNSMDFFDVSLVDGYNLPLLIAPQAAGPSGRCGPTGCLVDINALCPPELRVLSAAGEPVACRSACDAFGSPEYCCSGAYGGGPAACRPSAYSQLFKNACPRAYSYAYDDATSTFTCSAGTSYAITFCPTTASLKSSGSGSGSGSGNNPRAVGLPLINDTMVFLQGSYSAGEAAAPMMSVVGLVLLPAVWWLL